MFDLLQNLKETRKSYAQMVEFCADSLILNNYIVEELTKQNFYFEDFAGSTSYEVYFNENGDEIEREEFETLEEQGAEVYTDYRYLEIYQYYIIDGAAAERFKEYTNEIIIYNEQLDLYILCVTHWGTCWAGVPSNWID